MAMSKKWLVSALVLPLALGATTVMAKGGDKGMKGGHGCHGDISSRSFRQLDLTDEQKAELETIRSEMKESYKGKGSEMREQAKAYKAKERELVLAANFNEQEAQTLAEEMVNQRVEAQVEKMRVQHRMMSVLTSEQKDKLVQMQDERMQKCEQKMDKRMEKKRSNNG